VTRNALEADAAMARYAAGDDGAFDCVYAVVEPSIRRFFHRHMRDRTAAEDLCQETFFHLHRSRRTFIPGAEVLPWALAIARRLLIDWSNRSRRKHREVPMGSDSGEASGPIVADEGATGEQVVVAGELANNIQLALAALSEPQRAAFHLVRAEGVPLAHAAKVLGTSVTGIKLRLHRVVKTLRASARCPNTQAALVTRGLDERTAASLQNTHGRTPPIATTSPKR